MNQREFDAYVVTRLGEVEQDLARLSKSMTGTQATANVCRAKVAEVKLELTKRMLESSHERPAPPKVVAFVKEV